MADLDRHDAFMRQFVRHQPAVYSVIRAMVFHRADADELLQETASVLWRKFDEFDPDTPGSRFDRWAIAVARNQVLYFRQRVARDRSRIQFSPDMSDLIADTATTESDRVEDARDALETCLAKLPAPDRELIHLRYHVHSTNRQVADATRRSESSVSRALTRVYAALLDCVRSNMEAKS